MNRTIAIALFTAAACAPVLEEELDGVDPSLVELVQTTAEGTTFTTTVRAINSEIWVYFSFETGEEVYVEDPLTSRDWDLRFSRFNVRVDGGPSGGGTVQLTVLEKVEFASIVQAPGGEYFTDVPDQDADGDDELAFRRPNGVSENGWFEYDGRFHTVTPADLTYVIEAMNGIFYKMQFIGYYDEHGEAGFPQFRWVPIASP